MYIKDCEVEATGGNGSIECSGIFAGNITLENSTLTASCNNNYSPAGTWTKGYGIRFYPSDGKLIIDNKSTGLKSPSAYHVFEYSMHLLYYVPYEIGCLLTILRNIVILTYV